MSALTDSSAWRALQAHAADIAHTPTLDFFAQQPGRAQSCTLDAAGLYLDYSKQRVTPKTLQLLSAFAEQQQLSSWTQKLFAGEPVNHTEHRAAAHMALRVPVGAVYRIGSDNVALSVHDVLSRMSRFATDVRDGRWQGHTGERITDVVNIGIGGSDLGPRMVCWALASYASMPRTHFIANVDGAQLSALLAKLNPATTLWIVTSKTFTTQETMANAHAARAWLLKSAGVSAIQKHFVAVSTNREAVEAFGISTDNMFGFWDWVGGRYSLWSAVGLSIMMAIGADRFRELLAGAHAMDEHFRTKPALQNMPVLMGLMGVWNTNFVGCVTHYLAPYAQKLVHLTAWLQQLEMESNGKCVDRDGCTVDYLTTPALWGDVGTNGQHAFFQMLHQGPELHAVDFILPMACEHEFPDQHRILMANGLAQSAALMGGKGAEQVRAELAAKGMKGAELETAIPHRVFSGNRPSSTILMPRLDPYHLGALLALYEHRTFVQSVLWNVNPFDQWGVELGKQLATAILAAMDGQAVTLDPSTQNLLSRVRDRLSR